MKNINTSEYWDSRFASGDWEERQGRQQTVTFAKEQVGKFGLPKSFAGSILDFGCGLGDAFKIYKRAFPNARFIGIDHSKDAINKCRERYSNLAEFIHGSVEDVPHVDVIISSNVFEHLSNDANVAEMLAERCQKLFIIVPYKETIVSLENNEHVNSYDETSFKTLTCLQKTVYESVGLGHKTWWGKFYHVWFKNIFRFIIQGKIWKYKPPKEIMFEFQGKM